MHLHCRLYQCQQLRLKKKEKETQTKGKKTYSFVSLSYFISSFLLSLPPTPSSSFPPSFSVSLLLFQVISQHSLEMLFYLIYSIRVPFYSCCLLIVLPVSFLILIFITFRFSSFLSSLSFSFSILFL